MFSPVLEGLGMLERKDPVSEIEKLLDELESFAEKSPWYLPNKIAIRDEDFFRITQRVRELLPSELAEARSTLEKRDLILRNAQEEHKRIIDAAEKRLEDLTSQDQVVVAARQHAERLIEKTWAGRKLSGYRNIPPADREAVLEALVRLSQLAAENPRIAEIEINPLRALPTGQGACAVDVRARLEGAAR